MSFENIRNQFFYHHCGWKTTVHCIHVIFFTAFKTSRRIIGRIAKYHNRRIAHFPGLAKTVFQKHFPDSLPLIFRQDTDWPKSKHRRFFPFFIAQRRPSVHHIPHNFPFRRHRHQIQFRDKVLMFTHNMHQIMLIAARHIHIPKGLSGQLLHSTVVIGPFIANYYLWRPSPIVFLFQDGIPGFIAYPQVIHTARSPRSLICHAAFFHHLAGIRIPGVMAGIDAAHSYFIKKEANNRPQRFRSKSFSPPAAPNTIANSH